MKSDRENLIASKPLTEEFKAAPSSRGKATFITRNIAEILKSLRHKHNLTQRDMADFIEVTFQQYQKYEKAKDRLSLEKAVQLCDRLRIDLNIFSTVLHVENSEADNLNQVVSKFSDKNLSTEEATMLALFNAIPVDSRKYLLAMLKASKKVFVR